MNQEQIPYNQETVSVYRRVLLKLPRLAEFREMASDAGVRI